MVHFLAYSPFIQTPTTISERALEKKIQRRNSFGWPYFGGNDEEIDDNSLIFRHPSTPVDDQDKIFLAHKSDVYVFQGEKENNNFVWYTRSNMVAMQGLLYAMYFEHYHVLHSYIAEHGTQNEDVVIVRDSGLSWKPHKKILGVLMISGIHIHRATGEVVVWKRSTGEESLGTAFVYCMRSRPPVPWYTKGFFPNLEKAYAQCNDLNKGQIVKLQQWGRMLVHKRKVQFKSQFRFHGWFALLTDDLFDNVLHFWMSLPKNHRPPSIVYSQMQQYERIS